MSDIAIQTISGFTTILDISADPLHETLSPSGRSWGLWLDTPIIPYRTGAGVAVFLAGAHSTYRFQVADNNWVSGSISMSPAGAAVRNSQNTGVQPDYDHRIWVFGVYAAGNNVYGIGHHEWYNQIIDVDGKPGFNALSAREWVTSPAWLKSTTSGSSWATKPYTSYTVSGLSNPERLYLTPEAYGVQSYETLYGFQHPSNIVKEGAYYYAFLDTNNLVGSGDALLDVGFCLIRWSDPDDPTGVQYWNGAGWTARNMMGYQGNNGPQQPHVFFKVQNFDPYTQFARTDRMAQALRYHWPSQQWLLFGFDGRVVPSLCFTRSKTLANPEFEVNGRKQVFLTGGGVNTDYNTYIQVFDPAATDQNYTQIGDEPIIVVMDNYTIYKKQTLWITGYENLADFPTTYTGNGAQTTFSIPWPYLNQSHVVVKKGGVTQVFGTHYTFPSAGQVAFLVAPGNGVSVSIDRITPLEPISEFSSGPLQATDLNTVTKQAQFGIEETDYELRALGTEVDDHKAEAWTTLVPGAVGTLETGDGGSGTIAKGVAGSLLGFDAGGNLIPLRADDDITQVITDLNTEEAALVAHKAKAWTTSAGGGTITKGVEGDILAFNAGGNLVPVSMSYTGQVDVSAAPSPAILDDNGDEIPTGTSGRWRITSGTFADPVTTKSPLLRIDKYENISATEQPNPGANDNNAAIVVTVQGAATNQVQTCGIWSYARGGNLDAGYNGDVCALFGLGEGIRDSPRNVFGGYFEGKKNFAATRAIGAEIRASNFSGAADTFDPIGASGSMGLWITAGGTGDCGTGISLGRVASGISFKVGFHAYAVEDAAFYDASNATTSMVVIGSHTRGIDLSGATFSGSAIVLPNLGKVTGLNAAGSATVELLHLSSGDQLVLGPATTNTIRMNTGATGALGFFGAAAVTKPAVTGSRAATEAGLASLLTALSNLGLITNSTTA